MADETVLTWNFTNWVSVVLMAAVGFAVLALVMKFWAARKAEA